MKATSTDETQHRQEPQLLPGTVASTADEARFWSKVCKGPGPDDHWLWSAAVADDGYGRYTITREGRTVAVRPHRYAHALATGQNLGEFGPLMHHCDVPLCVRATAAADTHVVEGTRRENMLDRRRKGRDANGSGFQWRGQARAHFAARSRALRDEVRDFGWTRPTHIMALLSGNDAQAPTLF